MNNNDKYNRQLKLVGLCMANKSDRKYDAYDLAIMFEVEYVTIQRDLSDLRRMGIPISQTKNRGIEVEDTFSPDKLRELLLNSIGMAYSTSIYDYAINQLANECEVTLLKNVLQILIAIGDNKKINSKVSGFQDKIDLSPLKLFQKDSDWYLLASINSDGLKHFPLRDLDEIKVLEYDAIRYPDEKIEAYIREAVFSNFKRGNVKIKLQFASPDLNGNFPIKHCNYKLTKALESGTTQVEAEVDSLDEVVKWLFDHTPEVKILEPPELITKMKDKVESIIKMADLKDELIFSDNFYDNIIFSQKIDEEYFRKKIPDDKEYTLIKKIREPFINTFSENDFTVNAEITI